MTSPSLRKPLGVLLILSIASIWAIAIASASPLIGKLPGIVEGVIYLVAGIVWIAPLGPILRWMERGQTENR